MERQIPDNWEELKSAQLTQQEKPSLGNMANFRKKEVK